MFSSNSDLWKAIYLRIFFYGLLIFFTGFLLAFLCLAVFADDSLFPISEPTMDGHPTMDYVLSWESPEENQAAVHYKLIVDNAVMEVGSATACVIALSMLEPHEWSVLAMNRYRAEGPQSITETISADSVMNEIYSDPEDLEEIRVYRKRKTGKGYASYAVRRIVQTISSRLETAVVLECSLKPCYDIHAVTRGWKAEKITRKITDKFNYE